MLYHERNTGKGAALRTGFAAASAEYVIVQDADLEYDPTEYGTMLEPLEAGLADVVFGSRFLSGRPHRVLYFWHSLGNRLLTLLSNMFTNLNLTDMETCFKAFRREVLDTIVVEENRFGFEPEITAKVARGGWRIYEVGIAYAGRTYAEGKKIGWRDGVRAFVCIVRYSPVGQRFRWSSDRPSDQADLERPPRRVAQTPAGDEQHRLDHDATGHLRLPEAPVGEHDRRLHHPVPGAHEAAHELGEERVALGGRSSPGRSPPAPRRGRRGTRTCSRGPAGRAPATCTGCPSATAGAGAAASPSSPRPGRSATR